MSDAASTVDETTGGNDPGAPAAQAAPLAPPAAVVALGAPANDPDPAAPAAAPAAWASLDAPIRVADIHIGNLDSRHVEITYVYAAKPGEYAVYYAGDVQVQYADDPATEKQQRQNMQALAPVRAELNALLKGWKEPVAYYWKIAYGLLLALDGDSQAGKDALTAAKNELLLDRAAAGRLEYLAWAAGAGAVMLIILAIASRLYPFTQTADNLWLAAKAGLVGAAFSIALGIRGRSVGLDIDRADNITDGVLRLGIGVISAGVLLLLIGSGVVPNVKVGDATLSGGQMTWQMVLIVGFVAGFLERLVPDILDKRLPLASGGAAASATAPATPAPSPAPSGTSPTS
ncbi:MAG TPA: hypothetical protein VD995_04380 [Azospirillum sp.]|nr:hypothetical protein [Azospirillum sp.]